MGQDARTLPFPYGALCRYVSRFFVSLNSHAQSDVPFGVAVMDVTFSSKCTIVNRTYATLDIESEVVDEQTWECPTGSVIRSTPVDSEQEALELGGIFVPLSGDPDTDSKALASAQSTFLPDTSRLYGIEQQAALGCTEQSFSKSMSYYAYEPGVRLYTTVYYYQEYTCASGISSAKASLSWNADLYWRFAEYFEPGAYYYNSHGCTNLSTSATWDSYYVHRALGHRYRDESINSSVCAGGYGESYSNYMTL